MACLLLSIFPDKPSCHFHASPHTQEEIAYGKRIRASFSGPTPRLVYTHARALAVRQAVLLFDAAPVAEAYHLVYGACVPQAVLEVLEALVDEGQLPRSHATAIEEAVLRNVDREGEWR